MLKALFGLFVEKSPVPVMACGMMDRILNPGQIARGLRSVASPSDRRFPCEDGHAQERSLFNLALPTVEAGDARVADRNFRTVHFTCGIAARDAFFIVREHGNYPCKALGKEKHVGKISLGKAYEQPVAVSDSKGKSATVSFCQNLHIFNVLYRKTELVPTKKCTPWALFLRRVQKWPAPKDAF